MRPLPLVTALIVAGVLYLALIQRDAVLAALGVRPTEAAEQLVEAPVEMSVVALRSRAREIDRDVVLRGETEATRMVAVRAETSGRVVSEPLRKGADVSGGDVLCEIDPGTRIAELEQARAALSEAEINHRAATELRERGFAPETREAATRAAIQAARAAVERATTEIERLTMEAPFEGILETDTAELGALLQPGSVCATIIELDPLRGVGYAAETQVGRIVPGAAATLRLIDGTELRGEVAFVSRSADPETRTFRVDITVPNPDLATRAGQTALISIAAPGDAAHLLPGSALTLDDTGTLGVRTVDDDGRVGFAPVEVLRDTGSGMLVGGLPGRADVIVTGQEFVIDGQTVKVVYREPGT
jgi:multidrug efflux system membrane fusion protein